MKRAEIKAKTIDQSNDSSCRSPRPNGCKRNKAIKRSSSKRLRQALKRDNKYDHGLPNPTSIVVL